ncbi:tripartite tricarboxylate transporter substrate binding protein [Pseudorhodoferax sp. Leaf267]|uniref:tripartite tricarboxylate transporter substrate binding protein n=1 Tax=Pseudorhodoferax sp. Leaf267 TaxID=1736316 RepID=UPI000701631F|nr:tripartite tricarboxylate transporter substrate binding protein [Pseudorhodoferax sp. Leaf267]KQP18289.1 ABC transporter substrate-binding protein [Pseudorhodoferax sp. Leaf267]
MHIPPTTAHITRRTVLASVGAALAATAWPALAQTSDKPVRIVLPISAGSGVDNIARASSVAIGKALGHPVVIENLPGAGGVTGASAVAKAAPDGFTLGMVSNNHVINPAVYKKLPYDTLSDFTPISVIGATPLVLVAAKSVPAGNVKELIALIKARPDDFNYASSGNGTIIHLAGEMFVEQAGLKVRHIPYKGTGPMVNDLLGGQVQFGVVALPAIQAHIKSGSVKAIGLCGAQRSAAAPDIPTIAEQGLPDYAVEGWFAVIGPARLPAADVQRVHEALVKAYASPEVMDAMTRQGNTIRPTSPDEAAKFFRSEAARYAALVKKANVTLD